MKKLKKKKKPGLSKQDLIDTSWKKRAQEDYRKMKDGDSFKFPEGETTFRILPNAGGPYRQYRCHTEVGPNRRLIRCGKDEHGKGTCYLCDTVIPEYGKSKNHVKNEMAAAMAPVTMLVMYFAVQDPRSEKWRGPKTFRARMGGNRSLSAQLMNVIQSGKVNYIDPEKGRNLTIERTGVDLKTRYGVLEPDEESSAVDSDILARLEPLDKAIPVYSEAEQQKALTGDDSKQGGGGSSGKNRRPTPDHDDDTDEDDRSEDTDDDDDEDDRKGKKKKKRKSDDDDDRKGKKKKKRKSDDDDDDADDDDDDDADGDDDDEDEDDRKGKKKKKPAPRAEKKKKAGKPAKKKRK